MQNQVILALRALDLVTAVNEPTPSLEGLVDAYETERYKGLLAELVARTYPYVLELDLKTVTPSTFAESFKNNSSAKEDSLRKCRTFFLNAAKDAGIEVGPRIDNASFARSRSSTGKRHRKAAPSPSQIKENSVVIPDPLAKPSAIVEQLLNKFPEFDPKWPDEIKKQWFEGFDRFMSGAGVGAKSTGD